MRHYIIIKLKDRSKRDEIAARAEEIFSQTLSIPGVETLSVRKSCSDKSNRFDVMIEIGLEPQALPVYDASEPHQRWKAYCDPYLESKTIFDCEE